jgi:CheY-like chemotaxis protein
MSLLGRLEDLSLTDIVQIVYLSRRTGVLEIINDDGRHTVLFRGGLVVNASSPELPDLLMFLVAAGLITRANADIVRRMEEQAIPAGTSLVEMNLMSKDDLGNAIRQRVLTVMTPLLQSKEGEFNFILSDSMSAFDIEYDPDDIFKDGGFSPARIVGAPEGEKIKPLKGLEESLKIGKALLRGTAAPEATPASLNLGLGQPIEPSHPAPAPVPEPERSDNNILPFPAREEKPFTPIEELPDQLSGGQAILPVREEQDRRDRLSSTSASGQFKVAGGLFEVETPEAAFRNVVLFERNPLVRVAARRAFTHEGAKIFQFGTIDDVRSALTDLFAANSFFVTFLEVTEDESSTRLMQQVKRKNARLPVVMIDSSADLRRRHNLLRAGADLYVTKPSPARLQPGLIEEELSLFADELVLFAGRQFEQWERLTHGLGPNAGKHFYEMATKETIDRSFNLLRQLINELSNPNDIGQVSATILRLSAEYLDRGALFVARKEGFVGLGGFGFAGQGQDLDARVRQLKIAADQPSILADVAKSGVVHHGKMRRTPANVSLIEGLGNVLPTEVVALPIMHSKRAIGILYGDNAEHRAPIDSMTGLEIFLSQAGYAFGNAVFASERTRR